MSLQKTDGYGSSVAGMLAEEPTAVILPGVVLYATAVLMHDQVFAKAGDGPVELELLAAIVAFSRGRKNFDDEQRIQNVVLLVAGQLRFTTNDAAIGVSIGFGCGYVYAQVSVEDAASGGDLAVEKRADAIREEGVIERASRHGKHLAVVELALGFGLTFEAQVFFLSEGRRWEAGHVTIMARPA